MRKFSFVDDLTSDVMFRAYGKTPGELFEHAALAMFSVICKIEEIPSETGIDIAVEGEDLEDLLYAWLSHLLAESEIQGLFFSSFKVEVLKGRLKGKAFGSQSDPSKGKTLVKAVTMYKFGIIKTKEGYEATVACDI
jgi:SHS2 domain-containing protein